MSYKVEMIDIAELIPYENNPRDNKNSIEKVAESIRNYGFKVPVVVDENNIILAGHTRVLAAKLLGLKKVPTHTATGLSKQQKTAFRIMDNKVHEFSEWDMGLLAKEFENLAEQDFDLGLTGFEFSEIGKITKGAMLEFDAPDLELSDTDWSAEGVYIPETNIKQFMLLYDISTIEEMKTMIEALREEYKIESPSDIIFEAVTREYKKNTNL